MKNLNHKLTHLQQTVRALERVTVALSGGVDSMTLAFIAHQVLGDNARMVHSISPAVPPNDTQRIREFAAKYQWNIEYVSTGEIDTPSYKNNPVNRCYYCKTCLYSTLKRLAFGQVVSGTNLDDLGDYRPGLIAAKEHNIVHPFVEAKINKQEIRQLALQLGLPAISKLPASPCLASRIETGIHIDNNNLGLVDAVEQHLRSRINSATLRCRVKKQQIGIELDNETFKNLTQQEIDSLKRDIAKIIDNFSSNLPIQFMPYQQGSAFVGDKQCLTSL
ncbi:ATP-dependent sacrificial sulfur transferase LarE [Vibrio superstes]|uniref:TIGR00268 family protein n=1 Tax=Vibrio superstes NBRC 103154 TaxID=1219062 RepID=A0A511QP34_9VIBR|nr:ATP-dependent sacrificial sulfur transferase LarE [Vibrio superstes]GEM79093.1 TIGR00268 family protein [Vibrio superstes NBRC 103154]